jgi:hypothetical protein
MADAEPLTEDENEDAAAGDESVSALLEQLARELGTLVLYESRLQAARHRPELRQAGLGVVATLAVGIAFVCAFAFANVAAVAALSESMPAWAAALVLAAGWAVAGGHAAPSAGEPHPLSAAARLASSAKGTHFAPIPRGAA